MSTVISYEVEVRGRASEEALRSLVDHVDELAEIPSGDPELAQMGNPCG